MSSKSPEIQATTLTAFSKLCMKLESWKEFQVAINLAAKLTTEDFDILRKLVVETKLLESKEKSPLPPVLGLKNYKPSASLIIQQPNKIPPQTAQKKRKPQKSTGQLPSWSILS